MGESEKKRGNVWRTVLTVVIWILGIILFVNIVEWLKPGLLTEFFKAAHLYDIVKYVFVGKY